MDIILIGIGSVTLVGIVCAVLLSVASKLMAVHVDERVVKLTEALPGTNCGACGYPGCGGYATALGVQNSEVKANLCTPGGAAVAGALSELLGVEAGDVAAKIAVIHCRGDCNVKEKKMEYKGIQTCVAAKQLFGGDGACAYGCLGYGDCLPVCPDDAICMVDGLARIIASRCTGCGLCVKLCPNRLISIDDVGEATVIMCNSLDKGAVARKKCKNACLGCRKCARECPSSAIIVEDNLAKIDYTKCVHCAHCAETCVTQSIQPMCPQIQKTG